MKKISLLALIICSIPHMAGAETLNDVLAFTYENNPTIMAERTNLKATDEGVARAKSGYRPTVIAKGSIGRTHNKLEYDDILGDATYNQTPTDVSVSLVQPVFSGLSTYQSVRMAKSQVMAGRSTLLDTEQMVFLDAIGAYMNVIRDQAVLDLQINNEKVLKKHLESYKKKFRVGEITRTDIAQSEARLSGATANRIAAEGQLQVSKANYRDIIGQEPIDLKDVVSFEQGLPQSLDEALTLALNENPKIKAAEYMQMASKYDVKAKQGVLSPSVDLTAQAGRQTKTTTIDKNDYWQVAANLSVPLYQSGAEYANVRASKQIANQYRILLEKTRRAVKADTTSAWESYNAKKAQIVSIQDQIKASKTALDGVIREANVGQRTVLDVLDAEQEHLDNQVQLVRAHREEVISAYRLLSAIGKLTPTGLGLSVEQYDPSVYYNDVANKWIGWGIDE